MDSERGRFVSPKEYVDMPPMEQERIAQCPTLAVNEIVEIKGVRFRVVEMRSRGRLKLKMLATGAA